MTIKHYLLLLFAFSSASLFGQVEEPPPSLETEVNTLTVEPEKPAPDEKVYELFDLSKLPVFPGGEPEMFQFIFQNLKYPLLAKEKGISGHVIISFIINTDGKITEARIVKDIGGGCGKEALRVVESMPVWTPGELEGKVVKSRYTLPVRFRLN